MPPLNPSLGYARRAKEALRDLAHGTQLIEDPNDISTVLGDLSDGLASLSQTLHQIGQAHDHRSPHGADGLGASRRDRATSYQVSWELHRAAEMVDQLAVGIERAREIEPTTAQTIGHAPRPADVSRPVSAVELSL